LITPPRESVKMKKNYLITSYFGAKGRKALRRQQPVAGRACIKGQTRRRESQVSKHGDGKYESNSGQARWTGNSTLRLAGDKKEDNLRAQGGKDLSGKNQKRRGGFK